MRRACAAALLLLPGAAAGDETCVCYTRNMVPKGFSLGMMPSRLRRAALSAESLRRASPGTRTCLFTDAGVVPQRHLFDVVVQTTEDAGDPLVRRLKALGSRISTTARSRIGRLQNLARAPCNVTLFVDDDTFFCRDDGDVVAAKLAKLFLAKGPDVRMFQFGKTAREKQIEAAARECERGCLRRRCDVGDVVKCYDDAGARCSGAQGGAVAAEYVRGRLSLTDSALEAADWHDQTALHLLSKATCQNDAWVLGHLPYTFNFRGVKRASFIGPVTLLHQKALFHGNSTMAQHHQRLAAVCHELNQNVGERLATVDVARHRLNPIDHAASRNR